MGDDFVKYYVCSHNRWNPYSEDVKNIPSIYWTIQFHIISLELKQQWNFLYKPAAELVAHIANPQVFKVYFDNLKKEEKRNKEVQEEGFYESKRKEGGSESTYSESEANTHYDPNLGLVDNNGNVIIPKKDYDKMLGIDGIAISY